MFRAGCSSVAPALSGVWPLSRALGTPRYSCPLQEWFLTPFFRTRPKTVLCPTSEWLAEPQVFCECSTLCTGEGAAPDAAQLSGIPHLRIQTTAHFCLSAFRPLDVVSRILSWALQQVNYLSPCKASLSLPSVYWILYLNKLWSKFLP